MARPRLAPSKTPSLPGRLLPLAVLMALLLVVMKAILAFPTIIDTLISGDNDDIMRLMSIRAWLDGQSWFDMTQYRLLPPEGVSMHWSRFVDLGIASIIKPLSWLVEMPTAERLALVIWPSLLCVALILITVRGCRPLLGPLGTAFAILALLVWFPIGGMFFAPGHIDHHNVQIVMMTLLCYAMIGEGPAVRRGIVGAIATAFSLAVGLETVVFVAVAGAIMAFRAAHDREGAASLLRAFCLTLLPASALLLAGQTAPSDWLVAHCDAIGTPILAVELIAAVACLVPLAARQWLPTPALRLVVTLGLAGLGVALFSNLLWPCASGPYGALPLDIQNLMTTRIGEAKPGLAFAAIRPLVYGTIMVPPLVLLAASALIWFTRRTQTQATQNAAWQMIALGSIGVIGSFEQIRMITLAAATVPFLAGYVFAGLADLWRDQRKPMTAILVSLAFVGTYAPQLATKVGRGIAAGLRGETGVARPDEPYKDVNCRDAQIMETLNALPKARILTPLNLGMPLIFLTHHDGLTAPYHRSADAFANGINPFIDPAEMTKAIARTGAQYVVVCRGDEPGDEFKVTKSLLAGEGVAGLQEVPSAPPAFAVFRVVVP